MCGQGLDGLTETDPVEMCGQGWGRLVTGVDQIQGEEEREVSGSEKQDKCFSQDEKCNKPRTLNFYYQFLCLLSCLV